MERKPSEWPQTLPITRSQLGRRQFLRSAAGLGLSAAGLALLDGCASQPAAPGVATETLETTTIRLSQSKSTICLAPLYIAEDLLKGAGFTSVQYVDVPNTDVVAALTSGQIDMGMQYSGPIITYVDAGKPLMALAGVHIGCWVLFGTERVNSIRDLKGKTVAITALGSGEHVTLSTMVAYVGLNPNTDINWTILPQPEAQQRFTDGKLDALFAFPPVAQELQAKKIGHVVANSMMDKPWSQYYCCLPTARREFVQQNPVATKRALGAILQAADICYRDPERSAHFLVDRGYTPNYDYALQAMKEIPYGVWRMYDPADTMRFFALGLHDAGMVKLSPDEIIAKGTDWRFLNELKQELPAAVPSAQRSGLLCQIGEPG